MTMGGGRVEFPYIGLGYVLFLGYFFSWKINFWVACYKFLGLVFLHLISIWVRFSWNTH